MLVWWTTEIECASAVARLERDSALTPRSAKGALSRLDSLKAAWNEIDPVGPIRQMARRLLRLHNLRAGDALQLSAALAVSEGEPGSLEFVSIDDRLNDAASLEGLDVLEI